MIKRSGSNGKARKEELNEIFFLIYPFDFDFPGVLCVLSERNEGA